ncbi:hypothetical protein H0H81_004824 [Sphagnurus paluster]|uniref:Uncharacterized protein n=1 Tax=Sphagnurus paluster TaxID=117069 RepID=A0A9P7FY50_9AGAR|nr:hypothetical protein H0H81_004824 [Sphagnurus paluster]
MSPYSTSYQKKTKTGSASAPTVSTPQVQAQAAKKKANLKDKTSKRGSGSSAKDGGVLGGADYVDLMMGSRKKAKEEAKKLPSN